MKKIVKSLLSGFLVLILVGCKTEDVLKNVFDFLLGDKPKDLVNMRLEIKNPGKSHTFTFFIDPKKYPQAYVSLIQGELDGPAYFKRYDGCDYYPKERCNPKIGYLVCSKKFSKGIVRIQDVSDYYGGKIILRYTPNGVTKGHLFIDIKIP